MDPDKADLLRKRAVAHVGKGEYAQAVGELSEAIKYYPEDPDVHESLAVCYRALGDEASAKSATSEAQRLIRQAAERWPPVRWSPACMNANRHQSSKNPRILHGLFAIVGVIFCVALIVIAFSFVKLWSLVSRPFLAKSFDPVKWKNKDTKSKGTRYLMVYDLLPKLRGKSHKEVFEFLGEPDRWDPGLCSPVYYLKSIWLLKGQYELLILLDEECSFKEAKVKVAKVRCAIFE